MDWLYDVINILVIIKVILTSWLVVYELCLQF